jgi:hypothetical protein
MSVITEWETRHETRLDIQEIVMLGQKITDGLSRLAAMENQFDADTCQYLEQMSWDTYKIARNLSEIKANCL